MDREEARRYLNTFEGELLALMLVLAKCYDNKMVKATPHLFHLLVDSDLGG